MNLKDLVRWTRPKDWGGVCEQTLARWRNESGGLRLNQAKRFNELEKENVRVKGLVAHLSLDNAI